MLLQEESEENDSSWSSLGFEEAEVVELMKARNGLNLLKDAIKFREEKALQSTHKSLITKSQHTLGDILRSDQQTEGLPKTIGRFQIKRELGRGGFGVVLLATDPRLDRVVALKVPNERTLSNPEAIARFEREARSAALLGHPNIASIFDTQAKGALPYIAYEYCQGVTLAQWFKDHDQTIDPQLATQIIASLANAVQHAHSRGVVHRDLKPSNVMVGNSETDLAKNLKIMDFGLAKIDDNQSTLTRTGATIGTPAYMSPEQARGESEHTGPASDIHALGAMLYELLTGRTPYSRDNSIKTLRAIESETPPLPSSIRESVPRDLQAICLKCLEKEPRQRYANAQELANDLERFLQGMPVKARVVSRFEKTRRWAKRNPLVAVALLATFLAMLTASIVSFAFWRNSEANRVIALRNAADADEKTDFLRTALEELLTNVANEPSIHDSSLQPFRLKLFTSAKKFYERLKESNDDEADKLDYAMTVLSISKLMKNLGYVDDALQLLGGSGVEFQEENLMSDTEMDIYLQYLVQEAECLELLGQAKECLEIQKEISSLRWQSAKERHMDGRLSDLDFSNLINALALQLESHFEMYEFDAAKETNFEIAMLLTERYGAEDDWPNTFCRKYFCIRCKMLIEEGELKTAEQVGKRSVKGYAEFARIAPDKNLLIGFWEDYALAHSSLGESLLVQNKLEEAKANFEKSVEHSPLESAHRPDNIYRISGFTYNLALIQYLLKKHDDSIEALKSIIAKTENLNVEFPDLASNVLLLEYQARNLLYGNYYAQQKFKIAAQTLRTAIKKRADELKSFEDKRIQKELGNVYENLVHCLDISDQSEEAIKANVDAIRYWKQLHKKAPSHVSYEGLHDSYYADFYLARDQSPQERLEKLEPFFKFAKPSSKFWPLLRRKQISLLIQLDRFKDAKREFESIRKTADSVDDKFDLAQSIAEGIGNGENAPKSLAYFSNEVLDLLNEINENDDFNDSMRESLSEDKEFDYFRELPEFSEFFDAD